MNSPDSVLIVKRFFEALDFLIVSKALRGKKTFCDLYGVDRRGFQKLTRDYTSNRFQVAWLTYLSRDFGISAKWLVTGTGGMLSR